MSEWADTYRVLSAGASAVPGKWRTAKAPYTRQIMDTISDKDTREVVFMSPSQVGKTEVLLNVIGYFIHQEPSPILLVQPRVEDAKSFSKDRLQRMLDDSPALRDFVSPVKSRDAGNTIQHKQFVGGDIFLTGANAPAGLAMRPRRIVLFDEVDRYPPSAGDEGDPVTIAKARTATYPNRKIVYVSTPTIEGQSRIARLYAQSDKRRWHVPCPDCDHMAVLGWDNVDWPGRDEPSADQVTADAVYSCEECGSVWDEIDRKRAIARGEWISEAPGAAVAGFWIGGLDSPFVSMQSLAESYVQTRGNPEEEKSFVNTRLGKVHRQSGEAPDAERLYERRESYPTGIVPAGGLILTAGCDVQRDRIECEVKAWGKGTESWSVEHIILQGDVELDGVWKDLTQVFQRTWHNEDGALFRLARLAIDSGFATDRVYSWAESVRDNRVYVVKGNDSLPVAVGRPSRPKVDQRGKTRKRSIALWPVGVSYCKSAIYSRLRLPKPEDGEPCPRYLHYPQYDREWFEQLAAEQRVTRQDSRGFEKIVWEKRRPRNEALDLAAYNLAMAIHMGLENRRDEDWQMMPVATPQGIAGQDERPQPSNYLARGSSARGGWLGARR